MWAHRPHLGCRTRNHGRPPALLVRGTTLPPCVRPPPPPQALGGGAHSVDHFWSSHAKPWKRALAYVLEARKLLRPRGKLGGKGDTHGEQPPHQQQLQRRWPQSLRAEELCAYGAWLERSLPPNRSGATASMSTSSPCSRLFSEAMRAIGAQREASPRSEDAQLCRLATLHGAPRVGVF